MKVLIVAKTRRRKGACVGAISFSGQSLRLEAADGATNETAGMEYGVDDVWQIEGQPAAEVTPPHVENFIVTAIRRLGTMEDPATFIKCHMPPVQGSIEQIYDGSTGATKTGALYVSERLGVPPYSTTFWLPDRQLRLDTTAKRLRYRYPTPDGGRTLTYVGFQEPQEVIELGTLLRVSLAQWWRPDEKPEAELRCYVQLSGWFLPQDETTKPFAIPSPEVTAAADDPAPTPEDARTLLKQVFGFDSYWLLQEEIVANLLAGRDTLAIMPTGSGKSLCYQLPALLFPGLTVVVSPLISLMQDQVDQLRVLDIPAVYLNSSLSNEAYCATMDQIRRGAAKLLYVAPETLLRPETLVLLAGCRVDCLTVDEAHCISAWGHDFRPEYRQLRDVRKRLPEAVWFALTATATPRVRADIREQLGMTKTDTLVASFDRPNLLLSVQPKTKGGRQVRQILADHRDDSGIIYCATRRQVDDLATQLADEGWSVRPYHAGLETGQRQQHQRQFLHDEVQIMVATIAFGMGINKPNVRFVVHYDAPKNLESYYQQIGRAGRDGQRADCHFLFSFRDIVTIKRFIKQGDPDQQAEARSRLKTLIDYAETGYCRRRPLLAYFGEIYPVANCGMCDNCLAIGEEEIREDVTEAAQKFLSCVKRTGEIFGANHVIKVLRGSKAKSVVNHGHQQLSTYNIGREHTARQWRLMASQFVRQGLLARDKRYGGLHLTPQGHAVLGGRSVRAILTSVSTPSPNATVYDAGLFTILKKKRLDLANAAGLPAFVIFPDRSLQEMATVYPQTESAFANIYGVGRVKLRKYASEFLPLIRAHSAAQDIPPPSEAQFRQDD
ncbi:MAG: DNA helicase RecQ [Candidatus Promineifilaceae bacterium]